MKLSCGENDYADLMAQVLADLGSNAFEPEVNPELLLQPSGTDFNALMPEVNPTCPLALAPMPTSQSCSLTLLTKRVKML